MSVFRELLRLFENRFTDGEALSPGSGFETNIYQILGFLAVPGLFVSLFLIPRFMALSFYKPGPAVDWELRADHLFFVAYSFAAVGFATVFEWDMLFPDRRDFLILTPFPIRMCDLFGAKFAALGLFLLGIVAAVNLFPVLLLPIFSAYIRQARAAGVFRLMLTQFVSMSGASAFAFFAVASFQGLLINFLSPRLFRRISPWIQMVGMSLAILSILLFPLYSMGMRPIAQAHPEWLRVFPPYWFAGAYELMLPRPDPLFGALGVFGWKTLAAAIALFLLTWFAGFRRHYRRTLESEDVGKSSHTGRLLTLTNPLLRSPEERAIFQFAGQTLARSAKHRLFLAAYLSVGVAFGLLVAIAVRGGKLGVSQDGLRAFPLLVTFFVISGLRAAFQFPAELPANWLFRMAEAGWEETARRATRKRVLISGLVPALLVFAPFEIAAWGLHAGLFHTAFQLAAGALLVEVLFWTFDKVPFTCSYFPGAINLAFLAGLYLYGFTNYSFRMADLEAAVEHNAGGGAIYFSIAALALAFCWRRRSGASAVRFEAGEPAIQTLDLT